MLLKYEALKTRIRRLSWPQGRQSGTVLIIALLILLALSLLGVAGITTSTTEFQIAGNQYRKDQAIAAADAGAERILAIVNATPTNAALDNPAVLPLSGTLPNPSGEMYSITAVSTVTWIKTSTLSEDPTKAMATDYERVYYEVGPILGQQTASGASRQLVLGYSVYRKRP